MTEERHPQDLPEPANAESPILPVSDGTAGSGDNGVSEDEQSEGYFTSAPMRSATKLMDLLYRDDSFYESTRYAWVGPDDAKKLFLYGVCKEVMKACVGMIEDREHFREPPQSERPDRIEKLVLGAFSDTQTQRMRKLAELLSVLILFDRRSPCDEHYRVYLSAENLDLALSHLDDFRELYDGRVIANTEHSVRGYVERVARDLTTLGATTLWFLDENKIKYFGPERLGKLRPSVFASRKRRYLDALLLGNADERLVLGVSYGRGFSSQSQAVHPLLGSHDYGERENTIDSLRAGYSQTGLLAMHVMRLAYKLGGQDDPGGIDKVMGKDLERSVAKQVLKSMEKPVEVGDLILDAWNNLAEVLEVWVGRYGYKACRIRYLSRAPLPEAPEDWIESQHVLARLMTRPQMRAILEKAATAEDRPEELRKIMPEVLKQPDDKLMESARWFLLEMHRAHLLIPMLEEQGILKRSVESPRQIRRDAPAPSSDEPNHSASASLTHSEAADPERPGESRAG